ncbi:hypothetical protein [Malaciobacter mytili]|uniref:Uncharacterized protein n=1 Tax=Malaciobacter mytili LMG 24559 TaxID=1032238 RepID=A0AAX2AKS5_9BACT|nr:hypothetical protein [Malaciobacter mytili]AXH15024.1 hypothetical protein AMYT_1443 [Malaciobacter mytili LMG 24559]RXK16708.1 hypothetical protein CP985_01850 [Malaciobacter mytili LMG 24559]
MNKTLKEHIVSQLSKTLVVSIYSTDSEIKETIQKTINYIKAIPEEDKEEIINLTLSYIKRKVEKKLYC